MRLLLAGPMLASAVVIGGCGGREGRSGTDPGGSSGSAAAGAGGDDAGGEAAGQAGIGGTTATGGSGGGTATGGSGGATGTGASGGATGRGGSGGATDAGGSEGATDSGGVSGAAGDSGADRTDTPDRVGSIEGGEGGVNSCQMPGTSHGHTCYNYCNTFIDVCKPIPAHSTYFVDVADCLPQCAVYAQAQLCCRLEHLYYAFASPDGGTARELHCGHAKGEGGTPCL